MKSDEQGAANAFRRLPLICEENRGQYPHQVRFSSRGARQSLLLTANAAVLTLPTRTPIGKPTALHMKLIGVNGSARVTGLDELPGKSNYFVGYDPTKWRTNIPTYAKVRYEAVYPGVDLVYYGNQDRLEYDFVLAPGVDPHKIALNFSVAGSCTPMSPVVLAHLTFQS